MQRAYRCYENKLIHEQLIHIDSEDGRQIPTGLQANKQPLRPFVCSGRYPEGITIIGGTRDRGTIL